MFGRPQDAWTEARGDLRRTQWGTCRGRRGASLPCETQTARSWSARRGACTVGRGGLMRAQRLAKKGNLGWSMLSGLHMRKRGPRPGACTARSGLASTTSAFHVRWQRGCGEWPVPWLPRRASAQIRSVISGASSWGPGPGRGVQGQLPTCHLGSRHGCGPGPCACL